MSRAERIKTIILYGVFACYVILLIKILFLSRVPVFGLFHGQRTLFNFERSFNFIPFHSIISYISLGPTFGGAAFGNVAGNIAIFIPLGVYLPFFKKDKRAMVSLLLIFIASLSVEVIQGIFGIGASDIDDIILNCLGGLIGIFVYKLLSLILRDEKKVRTAIAILSVLVGLPVIIYFLFIVQMSF